MIGPVEEISKYMAIRIYPLKSKEFDEPIDAMLYSIVAALGFATFENFLYISQYGASLILIRAITGCLGHAGFSGIVGYYVGKAKFSSPKNNNLVYRGLAIAALSHGLFDFVLFTQTILAFLFIPLLIVLIYFLSKRLGEMSSASPFNQTTMILNAQNVRMKSYPPQTSVPNVGINSKDNYLYLKTFFFYPL